LTPTQKRNPNLKRNSNPKKNSNPKMRSNSPVRKLQLDPTPFQKQSPNPSWIPQASSSFHLLSLPTICRQISIAVVALLGTEELVSGSVILGRKSILRIIDFSRGGAISKITGRCSMGSCSMAFLVVVFGRF